jgi:putative membrane protein
MKKLLLTLPFLLFPFVAFAHYGDDFFGHHMDMGNFGFFGGGIFILLFWILIIAGIVFLVKYMADSGRDNKGESDRAIEILKERYAKGEISKEEFEQKKKELM